MKAIDRIYVLNLHDRLHRWEKFKQLSHPHVTRFEAVDSRDNHRVYESVNLSLNIVSLSQKLYFSQSPGAIGVYCSFYKIWNDIIDNDVQTALILEDDAEVDDVEKFLQSNPKIPGQEYDVIQLGKRCEAPWVKDRVTQWDGLEAYILTNRGARILTSSTRDNNHFTDIINPSHPTGWRMKDSGGFKELPVFKYDTLPDWTVPDSITAAADTFVGWNTHPDLPEEIRLRPKFQPCISLHEQRIASDIIKAKVEYWHMDEKQLLQLICSDKFMYWNE